MNPESHALLAVGVDQLDTAGLGSFDVKVVTSQACQREPVTPLETGTTYGQVESIIAEINKTEFALNVQAVQSIEADGWFNSTDNVQFHAEASVSTFFPGPHYIDVNQLPDGSGLSFFVEPSAPEILAVVFAAKRFERDDSWLTFANMGELEEQAENAIIPKLKELACQKGLHALLNNRVVGQLENLGLESLTVQTSEAPCQRSE